MELIFFTIELEVLLLRIAETLWIPRDSFPLRNVVAIGWAVRGRGVPSWARLNGSKGCK
jgi:hypothetical protein